MLETMISLSQKMNRSCRITLLPQLCYPGVDYNDLDRGGIERGLRVQSAFIGQSPSEICSYLLLYFICTFFLTWLRQY